MFRRVALLGLLFVAAQRAAPAASLSAQPARPIPTVDLFFRAVSFDENVADAALAQIAACRRTAMPA